MIHCGSYSFSIEYYHTHRQLDDIQQLVITVSRHSHIQNIGLSFTIQCLYFFVLVNFLFFKR